MTGFVLVDKPCGPTSHDVVAVARRKLGIRRVGHAGTLDPPASGLLVLGVGPATRLLSCVQALPKTYETTGVLGVRTTTLDADGEVVSTQECSVTREALESSLGEFVGAVEQTPPAVSAVKVDGERAYRRAARGEQVHIKPRTVVVHSIELLDWQDPRFTIRVRCSQGTYIRSLVADVGDALGCGAHVGDLRRTAIGHLDVASAVAPDHIGADAVRGVETVLTHMPRLDVDAETARRAGSGQHVAVDAAEADEILVVGPDGTVGVFGVEQGRLRPRTVVGAS